MWRSGVRGCGVLFAFADHSWIVATIRGVGIVTACSDFSLLLGSGFLCDSLWIADGWLRRHHLDRCAQAVICSLHTVGGMFLLARRLCGCAVSVDSCVAGQVVCGVCELTLAMADGRGAAV